LLAAFPVPAGATRLNGPPRHVTALRPPGITVERDFVESTVWWRVTGTVADVLKRAAAHMPLGASGFMSGVASTEPGAASGSDFFYPTRDLLRMREVEIGMVQAGTDVVMRVDAIVAYVEPKPASAVIGRNATVVVVSMVGHPGPNDTPGRVYRVTITDPTKVTRAAALINAAPLALDTVSNCPAVPTDDDARLTLAFSRSATSPASISVIINLVGCREIQVRPAHAGDAVLDYNNNPDTLRQVLQILGLRWPVL
jgi:hypothetical protein